MAITVTDFRIRFPEFATVPDSTIQLYLDDAEADLDTARWTACNLLERGVFYLAAHLLSLALRSAAGDDSNVSPISAKSAGGVSVSLSTFTAITETSNFYQATTYGQEYLRLRLRVGTGGILLAC